MFFGFFVRVGWVFRLVRLKSNFRAFFVFGVFNVFLAREVWMLAGKKIYILMNEKIVLNYASNSALCRPSKWVLGKISRSEKLRDSRAA